MISLCTSKKLTEIPPDYTEETLKISHNYNRRDIKQHSNGTEAVLPDNCLRRIVAPRGVPLTHNWPKTQYKC